MSASIELSSGAAAYCNATPASRPAPAKSNWLSALMPLAMTAYRAARERSERARADRAYLTTAQRDPRIMADLQAAMRTRDLAARAARDRHVSADAFADIGLDLFPEPMHIRRGKALA